MVIYRHTCGQRAQAGGGLQPGLDPAWATGKCGSCLRPGPWRLVPTEEEARDQGMAQAATHTAPWQVVATQYVTARPRGDVIHPDEVTAAVGVPPSSGAVGALFRTLRIRGVVAKGPDSVSRRPGRHLSGVHTWVRR